jgi:hypothetical protein
MEQHSAASLADRPDNWAEGFPRSSADLYRVVANFQRINLNWLIVAVHLHDGPADSAEI